MASGEKACQKNTFQSRYYIQTPFVTQRISNKDDEINIYDILFRALKLLDGLSAKTTRKLIKSNDG